MPICQTLAPTMDPTINATTEPIFTPEPTTNPTNDPTSEPTIEPTEIPSIMPSSKTESPTMNPTQFSSGSPTAIPSQIPTTNPSNLPSQSPSESPRSAAQNAPALLSTFDALMIVISFVAGLCLGLILLSWVDSKYLRINDFHQTASLIRLLIHTMDIVSDICFAIFVFCMDDNSKMPQANSDISMVVRADLAIVLNYCGF